MMPLDKSLRYSVEKGCYFKVLFVTDRRWCDQCCFSYSAQIKFVRDKSHYHEPA